MSDTKYYIKIKGVDGPVKVKAFDKCFELSHFSEGGISNSFSSANNGQAFRGVPSVSPSSVVIHNVAGGVSSKLQKMMLDVSPVDEITVYESTKIKGAETSVYDITFTKAHFLGYQRGEGNDIALTIGGFATTQTNHYVIDPEGKTTKSVVKYDLEKNETS
jgi:hypothetical protein